MERVLKDDAVQEKGERARMASFVGAMAIADLVKSTLGPKGMDKILQSTGRGRSVTVTNDGATILKSLHIDNPAAKVLVDISKVQDDEVGDGTTSVVVLAGELLREAEKLINMKIHPMTIIAGYRMAAECARNALLSVPEMLCYRVKEHISLNGRKKRRKKRKKKRKEEEIKKKKKIAKRGTVAGGTAGCGRYHRLASAGGSGPSTGRGTAKEANLTVCIQRLWRARRYRGRRLRPGTAGGTARQRPEPPVSPRPVAPPSLRATSTTAGSTGPTWPVLPVTGPPTAGSLHGGYKRLFFSNGLN
ncbi:hypothetical protein ACQ4PT_018950 [Festuca glaucescens]